MSELGINLVQIIAYLVIFFLLYFFTKGFIQKILDNVDERRKQIDEGIKNAAEAQKLKEIKLAEAESERNTLITKAHQDAKAYIERAKSKEQDIANEAAKMKESIITNANKEAAEIKTRSVQQGLDEAKDIITVAIRKAFDKIQIDKTQEEEIINNSLKNIND